MKVGFLLRRRRPGFTLTDLSMTLAVLAVLSAVVVPMLVGQRRDARMGVCVGNLRQVSPVGVKRQDAHGDAGPDQEVAAHQPQPVLVAAQQWRGDDDRHGEREGGSRNFSGGKPAKA